ncbi:MAG: hypothetical protein ACK4N6_06485, partial [Rhodocyclaceae bacterium]
TVVISAANPELALLPGMTANVRIVTAQKDDVLKVVNAALRFRPPEESGKPTPAGRQPNGGAGRGRSSVAGGSGKLWVLGEDGKPKAIEVKIGITDGNQTEIVAGDVAVGQQVIVGMNVQGEKARPAQPRMF